MVCFAHRMQTNSKQEMITKQDVEKGLQCGLIRLITDPNTAVGTVCQIGELWFYFGGLTADESTPEDYMRNVPTEDIVSEIYDTLLSIKDTEEAGEWTEYLYFETFLKEELKEKAPGMSLHKAIDILKMNRDLCMFNPDTGEKEPMNQACKDLADAINTVLSVISEKGEN